MTRTTADVFRLVPMSVFVIVPFMELLLPVALKIFPNMLPSTFEDKLKAEEETKRQLAARLGVAQFLQDTVGEMAKSLQTDTSDATRASASELIAFIDSIKAGKPVSSGDMLRFSQLFDDELTLDNLERVHLANMCRFLGITTFGTDEFLRQRLREYIINIKRDDRVIKEEGLSALNDTELREACRTRGMAAPFGAYAREFMEQQMREWLDMSLAARVPTSLLILSRALMLAAPMRVKTAGEEPGQTRSLLLMREVFVSLPEEVLEEAEAEATDASPAVGAGNSAAPLRAKTEALEKKLAIVRAEEEALKELDEELEERDRALALSVVTKSTNGAPEVADGIRSTGDIYRDTFSSATSTITNDNNNNNNNALTADAAGTAASTPTAHSTVTSAGLDLVSTPGSTSASTRTTTSTSTGGMSEEEVGFEARKRQEARVQGVLKALATLSSSSALSSEREAFLDLVHREVDLIRGQSARASAGGQMLFSRGALSAPKSVSDAGSAALTHSVSEMLGRIERDMDRADEKLSTRLKILDQDNDGRITREELERGLGVLREAVTEQEMDLVCQILDEHGWDMKQILRAVKKKSTLKT